MEEHEENTRKGMSRRSLMKRSGAVAAAAWAAPVVSSLGTPAFAASPPGGNCDTCTVTEPCTTKRDCGPGGECFCWVLADGSGCFCGDGNPCTGVPCGAAGECPTGWACVSNCCGQQCWPGCGITREASAAGTGTL